MPPLAVRAIGVAGWPCFCSSASPSGPSTSRTRTPEMGPVTMPTPDQRQVSSSSFVALRFRYGCSSRRLGSLERSLIGIGDHPRRRYSTASSLAVAFIRCAPAGYQLEWTWNLLGVGVWSRGELGLVPFLCSRLRTQPLCSRPHFFAPHLGLGLLGFGFCKFVRPVGYLL